MPKIFEYLGIIIMFYSNEHDDYSCAWEIPRL